MQDVYVSPHPSRGTLPVYGGDLPCREKKEYVEGKRHLRRLTVFVQYENVVRLLEFLGYRQDE